MRNHHRLILAPADQWYKATMVNRCLMRTINDAWFVLRDADPAARFEDASLLIGENVAHRLSTTEEMRFYIQGLTGLDLTERDPVLLAYGLPPRLYGVRLRFNHAQPEGTADLICGNTIVTLEPII